MDAQLVIALLNPAFGVLLALTFLLLWLNQRERVFLLVAAIAFGAMGLGSLMLDVVPSLPFDIDRALANLLFLTSAALVASAILMRRDLTIPVTVYAALVVAAMGAMLWFLIVTPDVGVRIGIVNTGLGAIALLLAVQLALVTGKQTIDWLLFAVAAISATHYLCSPLMIVYLMGSFGDFGDGKLGFYAATMIFSQAILSVMFALNLIVANAVDLHADLRREANMDRLSGLNNRRGFESAANPALERCASEGAAVCLLLADLDHFKEINDTWGHAAGDRVIALFGKHLRELCADGNGISGRIGGEEFAILLPSADLPGARRFAHKLRMRFSAAEGVDLPEGLMATVSIGISQSADASADLYALLNDADEALYNAKRAGRNQVHIFTPASEDEPETSRGLLTA